MTFKPFFVTGKKFFSAYGLYFVMFFGRYEKRKSLYAGQTLLLKVFMNQMADDARFFVNDPM